MTTIQKKYLLAGTAFLVALIGIEYVAFGSFSLNDLRGNLVDESDSKADTEYSCYSASRDERAECNNNYAKTTTECNRKHDECKKDYVDPIELFVCDAVHASCVQVTTFEQSICFERVGAKLDACLREVRKPEKCESEFSRIMQECDDSFDKNFDACREAQDPEQCREDAKSIRKICTDAAIKARKRCIKDPTPTVQDPVLEDKVCRTLYLKGLYSCRETESKAGRECKKKFPDKDSSEQKECRKEVQEEYQNCKKPFEEKLDECLLKIKNSENNTGKTNQKSESEQNESPPVDTHPDSVGSSSPEQDSTLFVSPDSESGESSMPQ